MANEVPWPLLVRIAAQAQTFQQSSPVEQDVLDEWLGLDLGDRLDRTNAPAEHPTDVVRLVVEGYTETIAHRSWSVGLNAEPYDPWAVGIVGPPTGSTSDDILGYLGADVACATRAAISGSATSIAFDPNVTRWATVLDYPGLQARLGGEVVDVSAIATTAATFVAAGAMSSADNDVVTPALYSGALADDWICVLARIRDASAGSLVTPPGYTRIAIRGWSASSPMQLFVKVHSGSESAPTVTPTGGSAGDTVSAVTFGLRNMPITLTDPNDAVVRSSSLTNASGQDVAYPALGIPVAEGCVVLLLGGKDDDWTSVATVAGFTEAVDASTTTGNDQGLVVDYVIQTTPDSVAPGSFTVTGGAAAVSGAAVVAFAGGYQTMTVARGANGASKAQAAGTPIEVEGCLVLGL